MAINTKSKRFSMMTLGKPSERTIPPPDGTIGAPDRAHFLGLYSGISIGTPPVITFLPTTRGWLGRLFGRQPS